MIKSLSYQNERLVETRFTCCQIVDSMLGGLLTGALVSWLFRGLNRNACLLMGSLGGAGRFYAMRLESNCNLNCFDLPGERARQNRIGLSIGWVAMVGAPLMGRLINRQVTFPQFIIYSTWRAFSVPLLYGLAQCTNRCPISSLKIHQGLLEWMSRPRRNERGAVVNDQAVSIRPPLPHFVSAEHIDSYGIPTLMTLCQTHQVLKSEADKNELSQKEPKKPVDSGARVDKEFYQLARNVAYQISMMTADEGKKLALERVCHAFRGCPQRQAFELSLILSEVNADANGLGDRLRVRIQCGLHELKKEILLDLQAYFQPHTAWEQLTTGHHADEAQDIVMLTRELGEALGLIEMVVDGQVVLESRGQATQEYTRRFEQWQRAYSGKNRGFWVDAFYARYTADRMICATQLHLSTDVNIALAQMVLGQKVAEFNRDADPVDLVGKRFMEPGGGLNREGAILLLKITGQLVDDGRLHTQLDNEDFFNQSTKLS